MFKTFLVAAALLLSCFVSTAEATLPQAERQQLILERAQRQAEARRQNIQQRKTVRTYYYYYQYQYVHPHYHYYQPPVYYYYYPCRPTVYFWYRF